MSQKPAWETHLILGDDYYHFYESAGPQNTFKNAPKVAPEQVKIPPSKHVCLLDDFRVFLASFFDQFFTIF